MSDALLVRITSPFREFGLIAGALYVIDQALRRLSPSTGLYAYELMVQPIVDKALLPAGLARNLSFREIRSGDPEVALMPALAEIKAMRFAQNAVCLGAYHKEAFIGYIWFRFHEYDEDEVRCTYVLEADSESVFDFDLYVFPESRMGIGFMGIWHGANAYLRERGVRFTFSRLTRFNVLSRRSHAHLGWKRVGYAVFLKFWGLELMLATVRPFYSVSFGKHRPRLRLRPDALNAASGLGSGN
jgi:hypothetical protein